jgi:hypothetical protein
MRDDITFDEAARALREAFDDADDVRVDMEPVGREHVVTLQEYERRLAESKREKVSAQAEEAEYREFATLLGIIDDEPPRTVEVPVAQHQEWLRQQKMLDDLMTTRDAVSPEEEAEYQAFLNLIGPV